MATPLLSVVIPVFNGAKYLESLHSKLTQLNSRGIQIIYVDDRSSDESIYIIEDIINPQAGDLLIKMDRSSGAGQCRNRGWNSVTGKYTLFFDVDDQPHPTAISSALDKLEENENSDVAICSYLYERSNPNLGSNMNKEDIKIFDKSLGDLESKSFTLDDNSALLLITNYPWNKIIRTRTYKGSKMMFGDTIVNNDVLGHWTTILMAKEIILSRDIVCSHIVKSAGGNITNYRDEVRLAVFDALNQVYDFLIDFPHLRRRYCHIFWEFALRLLSWSKNRVDRGMHRRFDELTTTLLSRIDLEDFVLIQTRRAPSLGNKIKDHLYRG